MIQIGDVDSLSNLGSCYLYGTGVDKNLDEAKKYFKLAAEKGDCMAAYALSILNEKGKLDLDDIL